MDKKGLLDFAINMYLEQERSFGESTRRRINLPKLPGFIVDKWVYDPGHVNIAMAWPELISERTRGKSFLDMGAGTGIAAIYVALFGNAANVMATDISPIAIANCQANAWNYMLSAPEFQVCMSDVFSEILERKFDVLFWNFPWNCTDQSVEEVLQDRGIELVPERLMQMRAGIDQQYEALSRFIREGKGHLNPGGEILLGASELVRHDIIFAEAEKNGYHIEVAAEKKMVLTQSEDDSLTIILYRLTSKE